MAWRNIRARRKSDNHHADTQQQGPLVEPVEGRDSA